MGDKLERRNYWKIDFTFALKSSLRNPKPTHPQNHRSLDFDLKINQTID